MKRRAFSLSVAAWSMWPLPGNGQPAGRVYRVGVLRPTTPEDPTRLIEALRGEGYELGKNLVLEQRFASDDLSKLPDLLLDLVNTRPDVMLVVGLAAARVAIDARITIPIVMFNNVDPVKFGLVPSLARPGGTLTGVLITSQGTLASKKLELLREAVPQTDRIALLVPDDPNPNVEGQVTEVREAAGLLRIELVVVLVQGEAYEDAFTKVTASGAGALFVAAHTFFYRDRNRIVELAERHRLPTMYEWPDQVREGGLMAYGPNLSEIYEQIADYIDRILKGTRAGDLPIVMPSKLYLALNLRAARAIGLTFPSFLLAKADELID